MTDPFEYDVFLSFSSADEQIVKPIWQELTFNGLRIFWSDTTLKKEVGNSWFEVIERSLERSRHMLLFCSDNSMNSKWVQREYRAFFDQFYSSETRRLIPLLVHGFKPNSLPLFLRGLQVVGIDDPNCIQELIPLLGGVNIEKLREENKHLQEMVLTLSEDLGFHKNSLARTTAALEAREIENEELKSAVTRLIAANEVLSREVDNFGKQMKTPKHSKTTDPSKIRRPKEENTRQPGNPQEKIEEHPSRPQEPNVATLSLWDTLHERIERLQNLFSIEEFIPERTLYVDNLPEDINNDVLARWFSQAGSVKTAWVVTDRRTGNSLGFGFIIMSSPDEARKAVVTFHGKEFGGRTLTITRLSEDPTKR